MTYSSKPTLAAPELFVQQAYINGEFVSAKSGKTFEVTDPASLEKIGVAPSLSSRSCVAPLTLPRLPTRSSRTPQAANVRAGSASGTSS